MTDKLTEAVQLAPPSALLEQLDRKGQVILYGPPGTGKTFHALRAAEDLVARRIHGSAWASVPAASRDALHGRGAPEAQRIWICTFHPAYGYEDFVEGLRAQPVAGGLSFLPTPGLFHQICRRASEPASAEQPFVLVIDEFNRGDAPRIFGELLTLLEGDKRGRVHVTLPVSGERFTVPQNVRILATMNTSDRSVALLDAALRRRFGFVELLPDPEVLGAATLAGVSLAALLVEVNRRLVDTLGPRARDLQIGHSYFMRDGQPLTSVRQLKDAFQYDILPLIQEYCADDPDALARVLDERLYDRDRMRMARTPFAAGGDDLFVQALLAWSPERLGAETAVDAEQVEDVDDDEA